jgi:hypothetical protein
MARRALTVWFLLALAPPAWGAPFCMSDAELMAEVATGFLFEQGFLAAQCDGRRKGKGARPEPSLAALHRQVVKRFEVEFADHEARREALYRRLYGSEWQFFLVKERKGKIRHLLRTLHVTDRMCQDLSAKLAERLGQTWPHIHEQLARTFAAARGRVPPCE